MKQGEYYSQNMLKMRRELSRLIEQNPEAFTACVDEYLRHGAQHFPPIPKTGGNLPTPDDTLAALLAEYQIAQKNGLSQDQFLDRESQLGVKGGNLYQAISWQGYDAVKRHLNNARKKAQASPEFAERVEFFRFALEAIGGSRR